MPQKLYTNSAIYLARRPCSGMAVLRRQL